MGFIVVLLISYNCKEEFMPGMDNHSNLLVVEGMVHNGPGPYIIKLHYSAPLNSNDTLPVTNCKITLFENDKIVDNLTEIKKGKYTLMKKSFRAQPGNTYKVRIETKEGKTYESPEIEMPEPLKIDSVYAETAYKKTNEYFEELPGYQFYIDVEEPEQKENYLFWQMEECYKYHAAHTIDYIYSDYRIQEFSDPDSLYYCWNTNEIKDVFVGNTAELATRKLEKQPLHFVGTDTKRLQMRYRLKVNQYTVNKSTYEYWNKIKGQITEEDFFSSKQPYQIRGNIKNTENPDEPVLGYFTVASVDTEINYFDSPQNLAFYYGTPCIPNDDLRGIGMRPESQWPIYLTDLGGNPAEAGEICFDCRMTGGTTEQPAYWEDN